MAAALHHGLHLRLYLANVEASHSELLLDRTSDLHGLEKKEAEKRRDSSENSGDDWLRLSRDDLKTVGKLKGWASYKHFVAYLYAQLSAASFIRCYDSEALK